MKERWKLERHDTSDDESYLLPGKYPDQKTAEKAAAKYLAKLKDKRPGDHIYIVRPDDTKYRYLG